MYTRVTSEYSLIALMADLLFTYLSLAVASELRVLDWMPFESISNSAYPMWLYPTICLIWLTNFAANAVYDNGGRVKLSQEIKTVSYSVLVSVMVLAGVLYIVYRDLSRGFFFLFALINLVTLVGWRILARHWVGKALRIAELRKSNYDIRSKVVIIGAGNVGEQIAKTLTSTIGHAIKVVGFVDDNLKYDNQNINVLGGIEDTRKIIIEHKLHEVIIALPMSAYEAIIQLVKELEDLPVQVRVIPDYFHLALYKAKGRNFGGVPLVDLRAPALTDLQRLVKRIFDILVSILVLILVFPLLIVVSIAIKFDSKGPVFFFQDRIGENGVVFKMFKFRSMVVNAESMQEDVNQRKDDGSIIHKLKGDPRITKVGVFIRRTSIDELPQLLNVVIGDMSLVGPRPELPWLVNMYSPGQRKRFAVPQGVTGWWQINGRSEKAMHLNSDDDMFYVNNYSFWLDIYILFRTPLVVFHGNGAF